MFFPGGNKFVFVLDIAIVPGSPPRNVPPKPPVTPTDVTPDPGLTIAEVPSTPTPGLPTPP